MGDEDVQQLSFIEQQLSSISQQRQAHQRHVLEIENALDEIRSVSDAYKIVGSVMVKKSSSDITKDLEESKISHNSRIASLQKQEEQLRSKAKELQEKIMNNLEKK